ncbi:MAG: helix-turn-helix domain-containing protein [Clostridia bacterium]|nr:helix-turn-helix domain-containing protein [Clostridia bacterium]
MDDAKFHGVDRGWMQAQWRDCRDKAAQLAIFRDMCPKATIQEILDAVGEPEYCGPMETRLGSAWTAEDEARIVRMAADGRTNAEIGAALGRSASTVGNRISVMRRRGIAVARGAGPERDSPSADSADSSVGEAGGEYRPDGAGDDIDFFDAIEGELKLLTRREEELCAELESVRGEIALYRDKIGALLAMAGGGLSNG